MWWWSRERHLLGVAIDHAIYTCAAGGKGLGYTLNHHAVPSLMQLWRFVGSAFHMRESTKFRLITTS